MEKIKEFINKYPFLILAVISIPAIWALFVPGYYGASDDMHIAWLHQMDAAIKTGQIPPRYVPDLSFGFGYPLFTFVFPLPFYIAEIFHLAGFSLVASIKALFLLSILLSAYLMYKLLSELVSKELALAGAALYVYTPYRSTEIYVRGAVGEALSFVFFPLIVLSVIRLSKSNKINYQWIGIGALSIAGLLTSHNISAYIFLPFTLLLIILSLIFKQKKRITLLKNNLLSLVLGFSISAYFWLPALIESRLMKYDTVFSFVDHFPTIRQLITPYFGYGASVPGPGDGMSFFLGLINLVVIAVGILFLMFNFKRFDATKKTVLAWTVILFFFSIFMMNHRSTVFWENIPLLPHFQFPWRFLTMTTFLTPLFLVTLNKIKFKKAISFLLITGVLLTTASYFRPEHFLGRADDYYLKRYIPYPEASEEYLHIQEEYLRLPRETEVRPEKSYPAVYSDEAEITSIVEPTRLSVKFNVETYDEAEVYYSKYYYPGWIAKVDSEQVPISPGKPYGQIALTIPAGEHRVEITYKEAGHRKVLNLLSFVTLLGAGRLVMKKKDSSKNDE